MSSLYAIDLFSIGLGKKHVKFVFKCALMLIIYLVMMIFVDFPDGRHEYS